MMNENDTLTQDEVLQIWNGETISKDIYLPTTFIHNVFKQIFEEESSCIAAASTTQQHQQVVGEMYEEDDIVRMAIRSSRMGHFPFFRGDDKAPTPLDELTVHTSVLDLVSEVLFVSCHTTAGMERRWSDQTVDGREQHDNVPRLLEAHIMMNGTSENVFWDGEQRLYNHYTLVTSHVATQQKDIPPDAVAVTVILPSHFKVEDEDEDDPKEESNTRDEITVRIELSRLDIACQQRSSLASKSPLPNRQKPQSGLRLFVRSSSANHLEPCDGAFIRYMERAGLWIASLNPLQRSLIGFPPPGHEYWDDENALKQVMRRYRKGRGFDPTPYRCSRRKKRNNSSLNDANHHGDDCSISKGGGVIPNPPMEVSSFHPETTYLDPLRLINPDPVVFFNSPSSSVAETKNVLSEKQVKQFRDEGYLFIKDLFPMDVITNAVTASKELWPDDDNSSHSLSQRFQNQRITPRAFSFPFDDPRFNRIALHPRLLSIMSQLLDVDVSELRIMQSACFAKRGPPLSSSPCDSSKPNKQTEQPPGSEDGFDAKDENRISIECVLSPGNQPMHWDFGNNTLLTPARTEFQWSDDPEEVQGILYYNDYQEAGGGTAFVSGLNHNGVDPIHCGWLPDHPKIHDDDDDDDPRPALYAAERQVRYTIGSLFLFQLGTWHRGTPVFPGRIRRIQHLCFRKASATWVGGAAEFGQPTGMTMGALDRTFFEGLSSEQWSVLLGGVSKKVESS